MEQTMKLPVTFDKCPGCGSTERLAEEYMKQLKDEGYLSPEFPVGMVFQAPVFDQKKMKTTALTTLTGKTKVKVITEYWDTCKNCGLHYCVKWDVVEQDANIQIQQPPPVPGPYRAQSPHPFPGKGQRFTES